MKRLIPVLFCALALTACETVENRRDMLDTQEQLQQIIKEEFGLESLAGFNLNNSVLIDVTIGFESTAVADKTVSELERIARYAINKSFDKKPRAIYIQIAAAGEF